MKNTGGWCQAHGRRKPEGPRVAPWSPHHARVVQLAERRGASSGDRRFESFPAYQFSIWGDGVKRMSGENRKVHGSRRGLPTKISGCLPSGPPGAGLTKQAPTMGR